VTILRIILIIFTCNYYSIKIFQSQAFGDASHFYDINVYYVNVRKTELISHSTASLFLVHSSYALFPSPTFRRYLPFSPSSINISMKMNQLAVHIVIASIII